MRKLITTGLVAFFAAAGLLAQGAGQAPPQPTLKVGDMAPDFTLAGTDGKMHKLSSYRGKAAVVIAWFPKAFTSGCTIECKSLADNGDKIRKYEVVYFMASTDAIEENTKFAKATSVTLPGRGGAAPTVVEKKEADFPMLSDPTMETARAYGVVTGERTAASRWTFYIDKAGKIAAIETAVRPATSAEDMIARLDELKVAQKK
ncbi:MAG TPA: redoxin domain-containing protein [Vicinamibacterales bacterium]|nr:redoxin domain-containing protein [Vicinamibacterales bacterium]